MKRTTLLLQLPNWFVRLVARFDPSMRQLLPLLGNIRNATSAKAERVLGWKPRPREEAIVATDFSSRHSGRGGRWLVFV